MVSMVDWSRLARGADPGVPATPGHQSRYSRQRESEAVRAAEEQGYFVNANRAFLEEVFAPEEEGVRRSVLDERGPAKDLCRVQLISLQHAHLRSVGDIGLCVNLRICILSHNYIGRLDGLAMCENLLKLDVSSNQISYLPGPEFWAGLHSLQILHLHDNPLGRTEGLTYLSAAPSLSILTLFDTPLSLKRNYRHHVVNSCYLLKALDNHVVSDEEIIEDAKFEGIFTSQHPVFRVNLCAQVAPEAGYEENLFAVRSIIATVNKILARHSPVLIIQKTIRGFITRRRLATNTDTEICSVNEEDTLHREKAAVTIQRGFRDWKSGPIPGGQGGPPPPTGSPVFGARPNLPPADGVKIDYDTYLQNRRPGSTAQSEASHASRTSRLSTNFTGELKPPGSANSTSSSRQRKNLFINLTKLQTDTLQTLQDDAVAIETIFPTEVCLVGREDKHFTQYDPKKHRQRKKDSENKPKRIKNIKQFFGPVVKTRQSPEPLLSAAGDEDHFPIVRFRLRGLRKLIEVVDPTTELILGRREAGRDVRVAEFDHHVKADNVPKPKVQRKSAGELSSMRRALTRAQTTMGMSCLHAVQQAYKDRQKMEQQASRLEYVLSMKEQREVARDRIKVFQDDKRSQVMKERALDQKRLLEEVDKHDLNRITYLEKNGELRSKSSQYWRQRRGELTFMTDFNVQNTSVSNALMRHDRQAVQEDKLQERSELVMAHKVVEKEQQDIVKKYLEHRQLMRQAEVAMSRAALDTKMLQEANDRLIEARNRVAQQKAKTANIQATHTFPTITTPSLPPVTKESHSALAPRPILTQASGMIQRSTTVA